MSRGAGARDGEGRGVSRDAGARDGEGCGVPGVRALRGAGCLAVLRGREGVRGAPSPWQPPRGVQRPVAPLGEEEEEERRVKPRAASFERLQRFVLNSFLPRPCRRKRSGGVCGGFRQPPTP